MYEVEIVVLANSIKHQQHCVAGKCIKSGSWIRPVSNVQGAELTNVQAQCQNPHGTFGVKVLQKIKMKFSQHVPLLHQPENYLIDGNIWQQNYLINEVEMPLYLDDPDDIWGEDGRVPHDLINSGQHKILQSLYLVRVDNLNLYTKDNKRRASFVYKNMKYNFSVTDPMFDKIVEEERDISNILCISLGEEFHGYCYKLVATIF